MDSYHITFTLTLAYNMSTENDNLVAQLLSINDEKEALARENADLKELLVKMSEEQPQGGDQQLIETVQKQAQRIKELTEAYDARGNELRGTQQRIIDLETRSQDLIRQRTEQVALERALREQISKNAQAPVQAPVQGPVQGPEHTAASTNNHAANTIAQISNLLSILNQQMRNDSVESAGKIDQLTKERDQFLQERDVAIATMKEHAIQLSNRFGEMRKESLDALKDVRTKAESVERLLTQRTNDLANVIEQRDNCIKRVEGLERSLKLRADEIRVVTLDRDQYAASNTLRVENANRLQNQFACKISELQKKLDESDAEVRRLHEMVTLRTDEKAKLQKQLDDLQPILAALSKHWSQ
jgi:DNA repair exonuclease SbcCD ATPase subunit